MQNVRFFLYVLLFLFVTIVVGFIWILHTFSGFQTGGTSAGTGPFRDYAPKVAAIITEEIGKGQSQRELSDVDVATPRHVFFGRVANDHQNACVVSLDRAYRSTVNSLANRSKGVPVGQKFHGCNDFALVHPPKVPRQISEWGEIERNVRHLCLPVLSYGQHRATGTAFPGAHISIATIFDEFTADQLVTSLGANRDSSEIIQLGRGNVAKQNLPLGMLLEQTEFEHVGTLSCDGFKVFQIGVFAKAWPLQESQN